MKADYWSILHPVNVPTQFFFHFFVFENGGNNLLKTHKSGFTFHHIVESSMVHAAYGYIYNSKY
jgi:hypothetical protein